MMQTYAYSFEHIPALWAQKQSVGDVMLELSDFVLRFLTRRLTSDTDLAHDVYIDFYENLPEIMKIWQGYQNYNFTGFLITHLRYRFLNYVRKKRRQEIDLIPVDFRLDSQSLLYLDTEPQANLSNDSRHRLSRELATVDLDWRLPVKLYYGLELGLDELQALIAHSANATDAASFLQEYRQRCHKRLLGQQRIRNRAHYYSWRLEQNNQSGSGKAKTTPQSWLRLKRRCEQLLENNAGIYTMEELAQLLRLNKTSVKRRIDKVRRYLASKMKGEHIAWKKIRPTA
ncbi:MAG: sigma-70 family RNA polymerase sigma factor [Leptospiraceae bacterium]|nr:sigma-70 family RNA polymerase sigma factor [Leptospiraceae bacterium]